ncbi:MAG: nucleotide sugar dehydrogenase [Dehalococcoidales bacterium]|nr:nucleotide sugar dehydrogenase [Dehalococcoidales bacterium]
MKAISVIGIGKLGFPIVACFAHKGYKVIGVDVNPDLVQAVNNRKPVINEPGLADLLREPVDLSATGDYAYAIKNSVMTFIVVPTPSREDGSFSTEYVEAAVGQIAAVLKNKDDFHVVVLTSTVLPGATEGVVIPLLERVSGKKCGRDFGLCYSPEFIALGSVIWDFLNPDVILIGESDAKSGDLLSEAYRGVCDNDPPMVRTNINSAELAKISLNAYVTMKISFANTLAELCERVPGGDAEAVSRMLGFDSRIGRKYLLGALAYGGPCFPRDNRAFAHFAERVGCEAKLAKATDEENAHQSQRIAAMVKEKLGTLNGKNIAILGLTYKPNTDVIEESAAVKLAAALLQGGAELSLYDPLAMPNARKVLREDNVRYAASAEECLRGADFCILATPWDEFRNLRARDFVENMRQPVLLDCWRLFNRTEFSKGMDYITIGLNSGVKDG